MSFDNLRATNKISEVFRDPAPAVESSAGRVDADKTLEQRKTQSTYQPVTGHDPYGLQRAGYSEKRVLVEAELKDFWPKHDPGLLKKFFPNPNTSQHILDKLGDKYGEFPRRSAKGSNGLRDKKLLTHGWKNMPNPPTGKEKSLVEADITDVFVPIVNSIISVLDLINPRVAIDRQCKPIPTRDGGELRPDVFIWGKGSSAFPSVEGIPPLKTKSRAEAELEAALLALVGDDEEAILDKEGPPVDWRWCICPIEIKTDRERGSREKKDAFIQSGTYVREIFAAQENRRFVPSLVVTECTVEFLMWDRYGVAISERIDYHDHRKGNHLLFCHIFATIMRWEDHRLGFDSTIFYDPDNNLHIRSIQAISNVTQEVDYTVEATLFRSYTLRGRGTTCWRARKSDDDDDRYIIMDSWVKDGKNAELAILQKLDKARESGGFAALAPFIQMEEVMATSIPPRVDSVKGNRLHSSIQGNTDLVHTRTIHKCNGILLEDFKSVHELLCVLYDVIQGHAQMCLKAKIIHRDIVPWNILIERGVPDAPRGILFDFSCATSTMIPGWVARPEATPASQFFMSTKALNCNTMTSHLDELESFYWILLFIFTLHAGIGLSSTRLRETRLDKRLFEPRLDSEAAAIKRGHFWEELELTSQGWFSSPVDGLVIDLHGFFQRRLDEERSAKKSQREMVSDPETDYREFLGYFLKAIKYFEPSETMDDVLRDDDSIQASESQEKQNDPYGSRKRSRNSGPEETDTTRVDKKARVE